MPSLLMCNDPSLMFQLISSSIYSFADHNRITNVTGYGEEAFSLSRRTLYEKNLAKFHYAFTKYPSLLTL